MSNNDVILKAKDLIKQQKERDKRRHDTFNKIYKKIEKRISIASIGNSYFTMYEIPEFILGIPLYNIIEAVNYIKDKLIYNGFTVEYYKPNILLISWLPKHT
jgi:hypothetical protein